jgi:hypothetical protein
MNKVVGVKTYSGVEWHAINSVAGADYDTLCGLDAKDDVIGHYGVVEAVAGQKITCHQCYAVWKGVSSLRLKESMFSV